MTDNYTDFLQEKALQIHELIQDDEYKKRFQDNLIRFDECCENENKQARENANKDPRLKDQKAGPPEQGWEWDKGGGRNEAGYWRPPYLWEWVFFDTNSDLPAITDPAKKTLLNYAILATIRDRGLLGEIPICPEWWYEKWGDSIWGIFEDEWEHHGKRTKRTRLTAILMDVKKDLKEPGSRDADFQKGKRPPVTAKPAAGTPPSIPDEGKKIEGGGEMEPNGGKEIPWNDNDPAYITNSEAVTLAGNDWTLKRMNKNLKPDGTIRYMRKGHRGKVHKADFDIYLKNQTIDRFSEKAFEEYHAIEERKQRIDEAKKRGE